jgi:plasmid stabilization system protein ParE
MKLVFHPEARKDLDDRIEYIANRAGWLVANRQLARVMASLQSIQQYPFTSKYNKRRKVFESWVPRTRFITLYQVLEADQVVFVVALIDHSRNTSKTKSQLMKSRS